MQSTKALCSIDFKRLCHSLPPRHRKARILYPGKEGVERARCLLSGPHRREELTLEDGHPFLPKRLKEQGGQEDKGPMKTKHRADGVVKTEEQELGGGP